MIRRIFLGVALSLLAIGVFFVPWAPPSKAYYAEFHAPCGRSVFAIRAGEGGPLEEVQPLGANRPDELLRYSIVSATKLRLYGYKTGTLVDDHHCGAYPEFVITKFEPWNEVVRPVLPNTVDLSGDLFAYTELLPKDRFVDEDFYKGTRYLQEETCVKKTGTCAEGMVQQTSTEEQKTVYCCKLRPAS